MRIAFALLAAGFLAVAAGMGLPDTLAGFEPDPLAVGLPLAGFVLAALAAALFPRAETWRETSENRGSVYDLHKLPEEGGSTPYRDP